MGEKSICYFVLAQRFRTILREHGGSPNELLASDKLREAADALQQAGRGALDKKQRLRFVDRMCAIDVQTISRQEDADAVRYIIMSLERVPNRREHVREFLDVLEQAFPSALTNPKDRRRRQRKWRPPITRNRFKLDVLGIHGEPTLAAVLEVFERFFQVDLSSLEGSAYDSLSHALRLGWLASLLKSFGEETRRQILLERRDRLMRHALREFPGDLTVKHEAGYIIILHPALGELRLPDEKLAPGLA